LLVAARAASQAMARESYGAPAAFAAVTGEPSRRHQARVVAPTHPL